MAAMEAGTDEDDAHDRPPLGEVLTKAAHAAEQELKSLWMENRQLRAQLASLGAPLHHRPPLPPALVDPDRVLTLPAFDTDVSPSPPIEVPMPEHSFGAHCQFLPNTVHSQLVEGIEGMLTEIQSANTGDQETCTLMEAEHSKPKTGAAWLTPVVPDLRVSNMVIKRQLTAQMKQLDQEGGGSHNGSRHGSVRSQASNGNQTNSMKSLYSTKEAPTPSPIFLHAEEMKKKVRMAIGQPDYSVKDFYYQAGTAQAIARSNAFDLVTLIVIGVNALWLGVNTQFNEAALLSEAEWPFQVGEHLFCMYFLWEWLVRFFSFRNKQDCLKDSWMILDTSLVMFMVLETWVVTLVYTLTFAHTGGGASNLGNTSMLRILRLLRLFRMARMARLLRAMPELMVMVKGLSVAMRSVFFTLFLLIGIIYVFAIMFVEAARGTSLEKTYFSSVPRAMSTLLISSAMPDLVEQIDDMYDGHIIFAFLFLLFVLLASLTVMNMLVGVLVEVVSVVSAVEKEQMDVHFVKTSIKRMMDETGCDTNGDQRISKTEFIDLLQMPDALRAMQKIGVDVVGLVDYTDFLFQDEDTLTFGDFMEALLELRGTNTATVKDCTDLRKFLVDEIMGLEGKLNILITAMRASGHLGKFRDLDLPAESSVDQQMKLGGGRSNGSAAATNLQAKSNRKFQGAC